ncbi:MAG: hypothetical protein KDK23_00090 [Leptospiraceae bacterium]|nr:hypothetical protein [Leptospiraceae bacterium]
MALLTGMLYAIAGCASDSFDDVPNTEETASIFLLITAPTRESALAKCVEAETIALSCTSDGGNQASYLSTVNTAYRPASTSTDATNLCNSLIDAGIFNSPTVYTYGARNCHFECNRQFWQARRQAGLCTSAGATAAITIHGQCSPSTWTGECVDSTFKSCLTDCFQSGTDTYFLPQGY